MAHHKIKSEYEKMVQALQLGQSSQQSCKHKQALKHFNKALRIAQKNGFKKEELLVLVNQLFSLLSLRRFEEVNDIAERGLKIAIEIGDKEKEGVMYDYLGMSHYEQQKYHEALKYLKQGIKISFTFQKKEQIVVSYLNLGAAYTGVGNHTKGVKCCKKGIELLIPANDENSKLLSKTYCILAKAYMGLGEYHNAIVYEEKHLDICRKFGDKEGEAKALIAMSDLHQKMWDLEKGFSYSQQSLTIAQEINHKGLQAKALGNTGSCLSLCGRYKDAMAYFVNSLKLAQEVDDKQTEAKTLCCISNCHKELKSNQESNHFYEKSLELAKEMGDKNTEMFVYYSIGVNQCSERDFQSAIYWCEKCLDIAMSTRSKYREGNACCVLAAAFHGLAKMNQDDEATYERNLTKSEEYVRKSIDCHEYIFKHLQHRDELKSSFGDGIIDYKLLLSILIETGQTQDALLISDKSRARALGDGLIFKYGMSQEQDIFSKPLIHPDVEEVLSDGTYSILHYNLLPENDIIWIVAKDILQLVNIDYTSKYKIEGIDLGDTNNRSLIFGVLMSKAYAMMDLQNLNHENRSLDSYVPTFTGHQERGDVPDLPSEVGRDSERGQELDPLIELYNIFIAPVLTYVQHNEIVIVPDSVIYGVPFAALKDPSTGRYLSETKWIRLAPSIAVLRLLQQCPADHHSQQGALIIGDPSVGHVILRGKETDLPPLPSARYEAEIIARLLHEEPLIGENATKDVVLKRLQEGVSLIHIAAHGSSDNGEIALAPNPSSSGKPIPEEEDYLLRMKEVQETGVRAKLVVLSCCHSGQGKIRSEGIMGLSRAFLLAGARAVVASLWALDDDVTFSFMLSFYGNLRRGNSASVSLDKAMKDIRKEPGHEEPKYWAPFFLIGDDVTLFDCKKIDEN